MRTLKFPIVLSIIAGVVWYIRSQPIPVVNHTVGMGTVVRSVMGTGTLEARTHDHRKLDVFDTIYEMEDGVIRVSEPQSKH